MSINLLGTVLASPVVTGNYNTDTYGTHFSFLGVGGWQELQATSDRDAIPVDSLGALDPTGLSSGRRRLGMLVYVVQTDTIYQLYVPYNVFSGLTSTAKVSALANNSNWQQFSTGGGDAIKKKYQQTSHGFSVGNVVSFNGTSFVKGIASTGNNLEFLGIVSSVIDANNFTLTYSGFIDLTTVGGLSANTVYFVSPSSAGALTPTEPFNPGESSRPILITQQSNKGLVMMMRSFIVPDSGASGSTGNGLRIQKTSSQTAHGFQLGDVLKFSGTTYQKAIATQPLNDFPIGIVNKIFDANKFSVCFAGYTDGMITAFDSTGTKHLSGGTTYYLSPSVAGKLTKIKPSGANQIITPIYQTIGTDDGIVINQKGIPTFIPISGVTGLQTALNTKVNSSLIGAPNGIAPLNSLSVIPSQYIPAGLKEEFVVKNISARTAKFYPSGGTGTTAQTMSFIGLKVFVLNASGSTQLPMGYTGSSEFIDTTGHLNWSATTGSVFINFNDILNRPNFVNKINTGNAISASNSGTGTTTLNVLYDNVYIGLTGNNLTVKPSSIDKTRLKLQGASGTTGQYLTLGTGNTINAKTLPAALIGPAEDGSYTDGIFTDFTPTTPVGTAVDRFNELFLLVLPSQPSDTISQNGTGGTFVNANLSWGVSRNSISYVNVGTNAGNAAVDINGAYNAAGTRLGVVRTPVSGTINNSVVGDPSGIPFFNHAFTNGDKGKLVLNRNGVNISTLVLTATTASTSNAIFSVSAVQYVKSPNGSPVTAFKYRTGTYNIPVSAMTSGYNYYRIIHSGSTFSSQTNFLEFVYDSDATNLVASSTGLTNLTLSGSKTVSGVKYHTSGTIQYQGIISNVYKNIYSSLSNAIDFPSRDNLGSITNMNLSGTGIISRTGSTLQTLPLLNSGVTNPQNTSITFLATFAINSTIVLGNIGVSGRLRSGLSVAHPFTAQQINGGIDTKTGFLFYNVTQSNVANSENYTGEVNRLQARDYPSLTYSNVNSGTYAWDTTQSLIGVNTFHNTGMLVFNGELIYPNATYLTTQYGITTGNFAAVTNTPSGNVNYTSASGIRDYYRKFTSANVATQSTLTFTITHTGTNTDFLTNGGTGGTPTSNNVKVEFLIMRSNGLIHGWANPFASTGNPQGISNTLISQAGNVTTVSCTLSTVPRVALSDIIILRTYHSSSYTNRVQNISVTNI